MASNPDPVVVIGAGLAGLHAAWRLHEAGVEVIVLEARDRVGGRTWSRALRDGTVVERGGEFIAPDDDVLRRLCAELGLELVPHGFSFDRRPTPERDAPTAADLEALAASAHARVAALDADVSAEAVLPPAMEWSPAEADALVRIETSLTVPLDDVSARRMFTGEGHGYDPADRVRDGNQGVAQGLARRLGARVWLRTPVTAVRHGMRGATVVYDDGQQVRAAAVVLAVPLPLLHELDLDPALPDDVVAAADRTRFGDAAKLHVPLAERPQPAGMASQGARWWCWTSQGADGGPLAAPVLSCFAGGAEAVAAVGAADGAAGWTAQALALRPDVAPGGDAMVTHWGAERWTRGSYSAPGIGSTADDDAAWTRAWGSVVLAGEHTAGPRAATMNGAAASGARAAETMLDMLKGRRDA
jgi:monoamine oxidase